MTDRHLPSTSHYAPVTKHESPMTKPQILGHQSLLNNDQSESPQPSMHTPDSPTGQTLATMTINGQLQITNHRANPTTNHQQPRTSLSTPLTPLLLLLPLLLKILLIRYSKHIATTSTTSTTDTATVLEVRIAIGLVPVVVQLQPHKKYYY